MKTKNRRAYLIGGVALIIAIFCMDLNMMDCFVPWYWIVGTNVIIALLIIFILFSNGHDRAIREKGGDSE